jgi:hypothetical protein
MKTQDTGTSGMQAGPPSSAHPKRGRRLAGAGAIIVVILVVGLSVLVFAQLRQHEAGQTTPTPAAAQWKQVLKGYSLTSLVAARSNPAVLYACATRASNAASQTSPGNAIAILHSTDFGDHWQDLSNKISLGNFCQLTVNPANSNEIYVVTTASNPQSSGLLMHSIDGGQTWETIHPLLHITGIQEPAPWLVQQIQLEGNHLFGMQSIVPRPAPASRPIPAFPYLLPRLVTSVDGGHNWTVIDNQFAAQRLGVHNYTVDPTNPNTIYDLLGVLWFPFRVVPTYDPLPYTGLNQELFKSTDGGTTWQLLLKDIPFASQVQLSSGKPQVIYVGGTISPLPLAPGVPQPTQATQATQPAYPGQIGSFHLQLSINGGANWQKIAIPSDVQNILNWYVSPGGQVYASPTIPFSGQPTAVVGTAVPITPLPNPTGNPQSAIPSKQQGASSVGAQFIAPPSVHAQAVPIEPAQFIQRYDPTTNTWSDVTRPPTPGFMLQLTPAQATSGAILWFIGMTASGQMILYRYVS